MYTFWASSTRLTWVHIEVQAIPKSIQFMSDVFKGVERLEMAILKAFYAQLQILKTQVTSKVASCVSV